MTIKILKKINYKKIMDIKKEIKHFREIGYESLQDHINEEIKELKAKKYLFKVVDIMNQLDKHIKEGLFEKKSICYMQFVKTYDHEIGDFLDKIEILDKGKNEINKYFNENHIPEYAIIYQLFSYVYFKLEDNLYNQKIEGKPIIIELNEHTKEKLKILLLNNELCKAYDYIDLLEKMPEKENTDIKIKNNKI